MVIGFVARRPEGADAKNPWLRLTQFQLGFSYYEETAEETLFQGPCRASTLLFWLFVV